MLAGLQNVTFEFGARILFDNATWHIQSNERIGLIGYNGTGKSTLLKLLAGEYQPSKGTVERSRDTTIGYLHQDLLSFDSNDTILDVALGAFENVLSLERQIEELGKRLEASSDSLDKTAADALIHEYSDKLHELETLGGYSINHRTAEVLQGLGFANTDLSRPYGEFSGGWRMRVLLAKMILRQPDLLLLDEPTNHLDLPSIEWLEKYLQHYAGAVVIVSHDKYFLNRMVTKIVEVYQRQLHIYNGNYDFYEKEKAERIAVQQRAYENQQEFIRQQQRFIDRFRAKATKAAAAQSAIKKLEKLERIEDVGLERPTIRINFRVDKTPGKVLVDLKNVSKSFGQNKIIVHSSAEIERGDKIALIGANGKGKSTLLRIIAGTEPFVGERKWGHNVEAAFYAQHQLEALNLNNTVFGEMQHAGSQKTELELRTLLGCFLFSGDDVEKKVRVLSGGEKARLALAKTIISKANFLLLDEPTNHLDMHSSDLLVEALNKYEGSYILVSHDRYFISKTANKIWEIVDHRLKEFKGGYEEYVAWKERMSRESGGGSRESGVGSRESGGGSRESGVGSRESRVGSRESGVGSRESERNERRLLAKKELQKQQKIFQQLEQKIAVYNEQKLQLEARLADPATYSDKAKFLETENGYKKLNEELATLNSDFEKVFEKIIELEKQVGQ